MQHRDFLSGSSSSPMASAADRRRSPATHLPRSLHTAVANLSSFLTSKPAYLPPRSSKIHLPFLLPDLPISIASPSESAQPDSLSSAQPRETPFSSSPAIENASSSNAGSGFPSTVRISAGRGGGPAFVGQVFSMCDLSGTGLMAVSTHFDIPFISRRTPEWLKKMFAAVTRSERNGPVFRFFMDLGDAVSYVKQLNIPSGVVGACRLDVAYEHFKYGLYDDKITSQYDCEAIKFDVKDTSEKPDLFQFVPNERQVKEANKLLKALPNGDGKKKMVGVPVFSAQNLDIAIATNDGIKWYTPYFFDKTMLDNILEESADQHFHTLIQTRNLQRRRDITDDNVSAEAIEEMGESNWEPLEVQEVLDEIGHSGIPLSVVSKAAEIQLLYAVDRVLLGNKWLRKATGIQPKFPYMVDSFEKRSAASFSRTKEPCNLISNPKFGDDTQLPKPGTLYNADDKRGHIPDFQFPFGDWFSHPWLKKHQTQQSLVDSRNANSTKKDKGKSSPFLPKITMVGVSTGEPGKMNKATLKKTMDDLSKELERAEQGTDQSGSASDEDIFDRRDPLFVANVGDYYSGSSRTGSARWVRGGGSS